MEKIIRYKNDDITVIWKPDTCIHSTLCWKGLISVFNPKERPWVKMDGATTERIIEQVRKCPSGALSYEMNEVKKEEAKAAETASNDPVTSEAAHMLKINVTPNGPYLINTECLIVHSSGKEEVKTGTVALCRCGLSANKPYCDGSHSKAEFKD